MSRMSLSLKTLPQFDFGKADVAFQQCLASVVRDMIDRPGDKTARVVTLKMSLVPVVQQDGDCVDANVNFQVQTTVPAYKTATRPVGIARNNQLFFQADAPDNPDQATFDEAMTEEDEEG